MDVSSAPSRRRSVCAPWATYSSGWRAATAARRAWGAGGAGAAVVEMPSAVLREAGGIGGGTVAMLVLALAAVGTLAGLLALLTVRPLRRLTAVAEKVAAGDLSVEVPVGGGGEVGLLTQVFKN